MTVQRAGGSLGGDKHGASRTKIELWRDECLRHAGGPMGIKCRICCHDGKDRDEIQDERRHGYLRHCVDEREFERDERG